MNKIAVARLVSIAGHPFTFIVLLVLLPFLLRGNTNALRVAGIVAAVGLLPLGLFMRRSWKSGRWQTVDASAPRDRPVAYLATFAVLLPLSLYFLLVEQSADLVRGSAVVGLMLAVGAGLNRWIKLSGHLAFAGFSCVIFTRIRLAYGLPVLLFIPLLAWSRIALSRHTFPEVIWGLALGLIAGGVLLWM
ncbi:MAG: hypothetical protein HY300_04440 [Verrucomicrobia bacterium]|nr:hypothetical protein [Verrucomicrobiota bacterium]